MPVQLHVPRWCKVGRLRPVNQPQRVPGLKYPKELLNGSNNYAERWPGASRREDAARHLGTVNFLW